MATAQDLMTALERERMVLERRIKDLRAAEALMRTGLGLHGRNGTKSSAAIPPEKAIAREKVARNKKETAHPQKERTQTTLDFRGHIRTHILETATAHARANRNVTREELVDGVCARFNVPKQRAKGRVQWTLGRLCDEKVLQRVKRGTYVLV